MTSRVVAPLVVAGLILTSTFSAAYAETDFALVGTHTFASQQGTALGRSLRELQRWNGQLYIGYGDIAANTGSPVGGIRVAPYDPQSAGFVDSGFSAPTEAILNYRPIGDKLYALSDDPTGSTPYSVLQGGSWQAAGSVFSQHVFDIATLDGTDIWLAGSFSDHRLHELPRSTNGGASFGSILYDRTCDVNPYTGNIYRGWGGSSYRFVAVYGGKLYVQRFNMYRGPRGYVKADGSMVWSTGDTVFDDSWVYDAGHTRVYDPATGTFTDGPDFLPVNPNPNASFAGYPNPAEISADTYRGSGWRPVEFGGKLVYLNALPTRQGLLSGAELVVAEMRNYGLLYSFDGSDVTLVRGGVNGLASESVIDFSIDEAGTALYALHADGQVYRTNDLADWSYVASAPGNVCSLEILDSVLYAGGTEAQLYAMPIPEPATLTLLAAGACLLLRRRR